MCKTNQHDGQKHCARHRTLARKENTVIQKETARCAKKHHRDALIKTMRGEQQTTVLRKHAHPGHIEKHLDAQTKTP